MFVFVEPLVISSRSVCSSSSKQSVAVSVIAQNGIMNS